MGSALKLFALIVLTAAFFAVGVVWRHFSLPGSDPVVTVARYCLKSTRRSVLGNVAYVRETLSQYYNKRELFSDSQVNSSIMSIESSRLPLQLTSIALGERADFAARGRFSGGALTAMGDTLIVMDTLGTLFAYDPKTLLGQKLELSVSPLGADDAANNPLVEGVGLARTLYIAFDEGTGDIIVSMIKYNASTKLYRFNISTTAINKASKRFSGSWSTIFETGDLPDSVAVGLAAGGRVVTGGGKLYFTLGDFDSGPMPSTEAELSPQDAAVPFGKTYEVDLATKAIKLLSTGHRNPQGMAITKDGKILVAEQGPEGGDELNLIVEGKNYGWPYKTFGTDYGKFDWPLPFKAPAAEYQDPIFAWVPSAAISPIVQVNNFHESWDGDLLAGSLKAQTLYRLKFKNDRILFSEPIFIGHRIRDIAQVGSRLFLITDDPSLIMMTIDEKRLATNVRAQSQTELRKAVKKCFTCHHFGVTNPSHMAPTLASIYNKPIASDNFNYSDALKKHGGVWDEASLRMFIANPNDFAEGSAMPNLGLSAGEIEDVIEVLTAKN